MTSVGDLFQRHLEVVQRRIARQTELGKCLTELPARGAEATATKNSFLREKENSARIWDQIKAAEVPRKVILLDSRRRRAG